MNHKVTSVFNGWLALTESERAELEKQIYEFRNISEYRRGELRESVRGSVTKMQTGPVREPCACCGRS